MPHTVSTAVCQNNKFVAFSLYLFYCVLSKPHVLNNKCLLVPLLELRRILKSIQNIRWKTWNSSSLSEFNIHNTRKSIFDKDPVVWIIANPKVPDQADILNSADSINCTMHSRLVLIYIFYSLFINIKISRI